ncbi:MAG: polysaccharide deacetylase family protein [Bacteroidota bacterium]|nr:polysaccharide deacetylase family protein [Bacteroidota bacterium]
MKIPGKTLFSKARKKVKESFESRGVILMYHRVADVSSDPWQLAVSPKNFEEHMQVLQKYSSCMKLQEMGKRIEKGKQLKKAVAVTFDDGYADNFLYAKPLLEKYNNPASIFVSTSFIGKNTEYWWDDLDRILLQPGKLPEELSINISNKNFNWKLEGSTLYTEEESKKYREWLNWEEAPTVRHYLYNAIWHLLVTEPDDEKERVLSEMALWAGLERDGRIENRPLTVDQLQKLVKGNIVDVGGHTVSHPKLSSKSLDIQRQEILQGKIFLEDVLEKPIETFSYPFGDFTKETVPLVREAGFSCACTTVSDIVRKQNTIYELPRLEVINWDGETFERKLHKWLYRIK